MQTADNVSVPTTEELQIHRTTRLIIVLAVEIVFTLLFMGAL